MNAKHISWTTLQYLDKRYHPIVKSLVSLSFMFHMILYNAVVLFVPSLSLRTILGISPGVSIGVVGASCLLYSTVGGLKAIIWTDFFQAMLMYLSVVFILIGGTMEAGGFTKMFDVNMATGRFDIGDYFELDLNIRNNIYSMMTGGIILNVFVNGASQIQVQRALSLPSLRLAQWSMLLNGIFVALITGICGYIGLILTAIYSDCDPLSSGQIEKQDSILFYYLTTHLLYIPGLRGLFVAGIFAATLSTLSSFQNSMAAIALEDFIKPHLEHRGKPLNQKLESWLCKIIALIFGLTCIGLSFVVSKMSSLMQIVLTLHGALGAPSLSAFLLGMLTRFTNTCGVMCGLVSGIAFSLYVQTYQTLYQGASEPTMPLSVSGCPAMSNMTSLSISPSGQTLYSVNEPAIDNLDRFLGMTYLWIPTFAMIITCTVSVLVSILTGGLNQTIDEDCLVTWMQRRKSVERIDELVRAKKFTH